MELGLKIQMWMKDQPVDCITTLELGNLIIVILAKKWKKQRMKIINFSPGIILRLTSFLLGS